MQSGGLALNGSNDVVGALKTCVADLHSWYEITIPAARADRPNEYHQIDVKTDKPVWLPERATGITRNRDPGFSDVRIQRKKKKKEPTNSALTELAADLH